jgi:hypothetical protein
MRRAPIACANVVHGTGKIRRTEPRASANVRWLQLKIASDSLTLGAPGKAWLIYSTGSVLRARGLMSCFRAIG